MDLFLNQESIYVIVAAVVILSALNIIFESYAATLFGIVIATVLAFLSMIFGSWTGLGFAIMAIALFIGSVGAAIVKFLFGLVDGV
jgi:hypothetical protein